MQKVKKKSIILLALMWWLSAMLTGFAATESQDGVEITVTADRQKYSSDQKIEASVTVKNYNDFAIRDVTVECIVPEGYMALDSDLTRTIETLSSGGIVSLTVPYASSRSAGAATGDNSNILVWVMLCVLSIAGIAFLWFFRGNRRNRGNMISVVLCAAMSAALLPTDALESYAAERSNTISAYETVEVDGKEVKVEGRVTYSYSEDGDEESSDMQDTKSEPAESSSPSPNLGGKPSSSPNPGGSPSSSPKPGESPSSSPEPGESPSPSPEPGESPSPSPKPGESPSPSPEPGGSPSSSPNPGESPSPSPEPGGSPSSSPKPSESPSPNPSGSPEPSGSPSPSPEPSESPSPSPEPVETTSENGYYVVWDDFNFSAINDWTEVMYSSWDISLPTGAAAKATDGACFTDSSEYACGQALREFNAIGDDFTMEFSMRASAGMEDTILDLRDGNTTAIRFAVKGDRLFLGDTDLCALPVEELAFFKLHISPANGTFTASVNGAGVTDGNAAKIFSFINSTDAIDRFIIETGRADKGAVVIGTVRIYTGYYVNEKFLDGTDLKINDEWKVTGDAAATYKTGTQGPDRYSALLKDGAEITRTATYVQNGAWVEYQYLMEHNSGEFAMILEDEAGNVFRVATRAGKFGYYDGETFKGLYDCLENMWYHVMLKQTDRGTELYLNHKLKADTILLPFDKFTSISFVADGGEAMLDDIVVKDWIPLPEDYVPEPVAVAKGEDAPLVGLQSCNLWVEGEHFGYDWLTDWEDRTPVLGYYDEMRPEAADWELKYKIEHGIDFELFCWYRPWEGQGEPVKMARNSRALHDGYMNAEYSDRMDFAITWECGSGGHDLEDFKKNIVPYWVEQYFKDDRYLKVENKPLVGMYNISRLKGYFGGSEGVKEAVAYLRQACVEAGFDGAYIIMCNDGLTANAAEIAQAGFDGQYAYTWGSDSYTVTKQTMGMEAVQNAVEGVGLAEKGVVPTASVGFWDKAWDRNDGAFCTVEQFQTVLEWIRDFMKEELDPDSIGSKMLLLDNWNEFSEGHFIMPSSLAGFGYIDAVRGVFGDGDGVGGAHTVDGKTDIVPDAKQRARINHMYVQDRHVVLVDKGSDRSSLEAIEGYDWQFNQNGDVEGWTVGKDDGRWIKRLAEQKVEGGKYYGKTVSPDELKMTDRGQETADPSLMSPDNLNLDAREAVEIRIRMKAGSGKEPIGQPAVYFITDKEPSYSSSKMAVASYMEGEDGYAELVFDMSQNHSWTGTIRQIRFDPIERDGEFWIDSITILRRKVGGDAEVYMNGSRFYTANPVETVDGRLMFPAEELSSLAGAYVSEPLERDRLHIYTGMGMLEFPYEGEVRMLADNVPVNSVGAVTLNGRKYVPIVDYFENAGKVTDIQGTEHSAFEVEVVPAEGEKPARVNITRFEDPAILKAYYFTTGTEAWTYGGSDTTTEPAVDEKGAMWISARGADTRVWSPEAAQFNVRAGKADHILMRVKIEGAGENPVLKGEIYGDGTNYSQPYEIQLTDEILADDGFYEVMIDLSGDKKGALKDALEIDRIRILWYDEAAGGTQTFSMDSFLILDLEEDTEPEPGEERILIEESPYTIYGWEFAESMGFWAGGGATIAEYDQESKALKITANNQRMNVWSSYDEKGVIKEPVNISTADATHVLVRVRTEAQISQMAMDLQYLGEDGKAGGTVSYRNIPYQTDANGDLYAMIDLAADGADWKTDQRIGRLNIYPIGETITEADNGKSVWITSVEILDNNWFSAFDSSYFTNGYDDWATGGTTQSRIVEGSLEVMPPTKEGDYNPRLWSMAANAAGEAVNPYNYTKRDVTHIRIRLKAVVPDELSGALEEGEKARTGAAEVTSERMKLILAFTDKTTAEIYSAPYEIGAEDYATLIFDVSGNIWPEGKKLARIGLEVFSDHREELCKAGVSVLLDSVQFLRRAGGTESSPARKVLIIGNSITQHAPNYNYGWAGDWGMAATSPDKDYVHLLEKKILEKNGAVEVKAINISEYEKYFYDWSKIGDQRDKYANWNADIIIATFGANVKNGENENDPSFNNDRIFSADKYKKIIDKFNPDGDAQVIAGATALTNEAIVEVIADAAEKYNYTFADMTAWTDREYLAYDYAEQILEYYRKVTGDTAKTEVFEGVLRHPGDRGMEKIAEAIWGILENWIPQGIPGGGEEPDPPELTGDDTGKWAEVDPDYASLAKGWYFASDREEWAGGGPTLIEPQSGMVRITGQNNAEAKVWSGVG
ncbi:MAG: hypothetical protein HFH87_11210, partial [Lachnospiraceae bacterium]|nr:hypothetical protein [Lachnospiraceae bacterium]